MIPFSLMWGGFAIFWETSVIHSHAPVFMQLWGIPFVLIGLYIIFGRFIGDALLRGKTFYGVTTQRILIVSGFFARNVRSFNLKSLPDISLTEKSDGTGSLYFAPFLFPMLQFSGGGWPGRRAGLPAFEMIERARDVQNIIRSAQEAAK